MLQSSVILLLFCIVAVESDNSTTMLNNCTSIRREAVVLKRQCINDYVQIKLHNTSIEGVEKVCRSPVIIEDTFSAAFSVVSVCLNNNTLFRELIKNSSEARTYLLSRAFEDNKIKNFFDNGGLECLRTTGQNIFGKCIQILGRFEKPYTSFKNSVVRISPLYFNKPSCSRRAVIMNCTRGILSKRCNNSSLQFVMSLHEAMNAYCNSTGGDNFELKSTSTPSIVSIIIGMLVVIILLGVIAFFGIKKICKGRGGQAQTYNVEFHDTK